MAAVILPALLLLLLSMVVRVSSTAIFLRQEAVFRYDTTQFDFLSEARALFAEMIQTQNLPPLDSVHTLKSTLKVDGSRNLVQPLQFQWNKERSRLETEEVERYRRFDELYRKFIASEVAPRLGGGRIVFQRAPSLRIYEPGSEVRGTVMHCDREYHHQPSELNFWLPLTEARETNSLWVESAPLKADFHPLNISYGEYCRFFGNECRHLTRPNETPKTRVSIDFRVVSDATGGHDPLFRDGVRRGYKSRFQTRFDVGGFYDEMHV